MPKEYTLEEFYGVVANPMMAQPGEMTVDESPQFQAGVKQLMKQSPEIAGGIGGAVLGQKVGGLPGALIGGVAGTVGGKEIAQEYLGVPQQSTQKNVYDAIQEELIGRGVFGAARLTGKLVGKIPGVDYAFSKAKEGLGLTTKDVGDDFITSEDLSIVAGLPKKNIAQAQQEELGERTLTTFEETAGKRGVRQQARLEKEGALMEQFTGERPNWLKARENTIAKLKENLTGKEPLEKIGIDTLNMIKKDISFQEKAVSDKLNKVDGELIDLAPNVNINTQNFLSDFSKQREVFRQKLGANGEKLFDNIVDKYKAKAKDNNTLMTASDFRAFQSDIDDIMGAFNPGKDVQKKVAGVVNSAIKPIFEKSIQLTKESPLGAKPMAQEYFKKFSEFAELSKQKGELVNNPLAKKSGVRDYTQEVKNLSPNNFTNIISNDPKAYNYVKELYVDKPEILQKINRAVKAKYVQDVFSSGEAGREIGGFNIEKIQKIFTDPNKMEVLKQIDPQGNFANTMANSALIQRGLNASRPTVSKKPSPVDQISENALIALTTGQTSSKVNILSSLMTGARQFFPGASKITDEKLYNAFKGENGQKLLEKMIETPLNSPTALNIYSELLKEAIKYDKAISEQEYNNGVAATINLMESERQKLENKK